MTLLTSLRAALTAVAALPSAAVAAVYSGPGLQGGAGAAASITGGGKDLRTIIINVVNTVLTFVALAAVIAIIVAGIYLIVGQGSDDSKEKAKKIIIYVIVGLIVILLAKVAVGFVIKTVQ